MKVLKMYLFVFVSVGIQNKVTWLRINRRVSEGRPVFLWSQRRRGNNPPKQGSPLIHRLQHGRPLWSGICWVSGFNLNRTSRCSGGGRHGCHCRQVTFTLIPLSGCDRRGSADAPRHPPTPSTWFFSTAASLTWGHGFLRQENKQRQVQF